MTADECTDIAARVIKPPSRREIAQAAINTARERDRLLAELDAARATIQRVMSATPGVITLDIRPFLAAMKRQAAALAKLMNSPTGKAFAKYARMEQDRKAMVAVANRERQIARCWLDERMDAMYADLGLTRDSSVDLLRGDEIDTFAISGDHETRGDNNPGRQA